MAAKSSPGRLLNGNPAADPPARLCRPIRSVVFQWGARFWRPAPALRNPDVQEVPLREMAAQRGWTVARVYSDRMSGATADRPGLKALMADARRGAFEIVLVWRFDRFARSVEQLLTSLAEFRGLGIEFASHQEALDTSTPMGKRCSKLSVPRLNSSET